MESGSNLITIQSHCQGQHQNEYVSWGIVIWQDEGQGWGENQCQSLSQSSGKIQGFEEGDNMIQVKFSIKVLLKVKVMVKGINLAYL